MRIYFATLALLGILAFAPADSAPPCAVMVEIDYTGPTGLVQIRDACLTEHTYIGGGLVVKARNIGDVIFKDGFDPKTGGGL